MTIDKNRISDALRTWWLAPVAPQPLALFRIGIAAVLLMEVWLVAGSVIDLYGNLGIVQWSIGEVVLRPWMPRLGWASAYFQPYGIDANGTLYLAYLAYVAFLAALLVGWHSRAASFGSWIFHLALTNSGNFAAYGVSSFAHIALTYCVVMPVGASISLDNLIVRSRVQSSTACGIALKTLQIHLCVVYFASGVEKAVGIQWWNGEAIWRATMQPQFAQVDVAWLSSAPLIAMLLTWSTLLIEIGYPFLIWMPATRRIWLALTVGMHLGIGMFLGLWLFASMMIVLNVTTFGADLIFNNVSKGRSFLCNLPISFGRIRVVRRI